MRVLIAINVTPSKPINPYGLQLIEALADVKGIERVDHGSSAIWSRAATWDIVHFHWPESLLKWRIPTRQRLIALDKCLGNLARTCTLVATVHNRSAKAVCGELGNALYETVYRRCVGFIHLGEASRVFFCETYAGFQWCQRAQHIIIEHGAYPYYLKLPTGAEIRPPLPHGRKLFLVFGAIRDAAEEEFARLAFETAGVSNASLVFAGQFRDEAATKLNLCSLAKVSSKNILRYHRWIDNEDVGRFFEASRFIFISRRGRLNSGVIPLAFTYNKPVIGPAEGVIGDLLRRSGNLTYQPGNVPSAAEAIRRADAMSEAELEAVGHRIEKFVSMHMSWDLHAQQHVEFYKSIMRKRSSFF